MWSLFWMCAGLSLPLVVARYWAMSRRQGHIERIRRDDPQLAAEIEQVAYARNPATLPVYDRSFGKPRRRNRF